MEVPLSKKNSLRRQLKRNLLKAGKLEVINPDSAGIDVGSEENWVAVPSNRDGTLVRRFGCFTSDIHSMADWLSECSIQTIAMESTGVYWIPLFDILESRGFEVILVNAHDVKNVPGRKTDEKDCQWLQKLHMYGLLRASFRPDDDICSLRTLVRQRDVLVKGSSQHILRMQKALTQMNVQLHKVLTNIVGKTGCAIIEAILSGERDPDTLARLRDRRVKNSIATISKALEGNWREELLFCLKQEYEFYHYFNKQVEHCDEQIRLCLEKFDSQNSDGESVKKKGKKRSQSTESFNLGNELIRILGFDMSEIPGVDVLTILIIISEIGFDMSKWPTEKHFCSWLGLCPNHKISGGKVLSRRSRKVVNRAAVAFRMAAQSVSRTNTSLGAFYRRIKGRAGPSKANQATANKIAKIFYKMVRYGIAYQDLGGDYYEEQYKKRILQNLKKKAKKLGYILLENDQIAEGKEEHIAEEAA